MIVEVVSVTALLIGGCALVRTTGIRGWALPSLGFLAGMCLLLAFGLVQVVTGLPTTPVITLALTCGVPLTWWVVCWRRGRAVGVSVPHAVAVLAALVASVALVRQAHLIKWHTDSLTYLQVGSLLADGAYTADVSLHMLTKRVLGLPLLHAPANLSGELYLRSVTPLLAMSTLSILVWCFRRGAHRVGPRELAWFTVLGALLLVSNNRFVFSAFYLNGHLLVAALLMLIAGGGWLLVREDRQLPASGLMLMQLVAIPALVITRPETPIVALLALLPTWLSDRVPTYHRVATVVTLGVANTLWQGFATWVHLDRGEAVPLTIAGSLALGILLLAAVPVLWWRWPQRHAMPLLWAAEIGLWLALLALAVRRPGILRASLSATAENLLHGAGKWGLSLVVLAVLAAAIFTLTTWPYQAFLRFPVTTFLPFGLLLAYLREEPYRVGYGDSLSRMFMHVVPLAVLCVMVAMASGRMRWSTGTDTGVGVASPQPTLPGRPGAGAIRTQSDVT